MSRNTAAFFAIIAHRNHLTISSLRRRNNFEKMASRIRRLAIRTQNVAIKRPKRASLAGSASSMPVRPFCLSCVIRRGHQSI